MSGHRRVRASDTAQSRISRLYHFGIPSYLQASRNGPSNRSRRKCGSIRSISPAHPEFWVSPATCSNDTPTPCRTCRSAVSRAPNQAANRRWLAATYAQLGQLDSASIEAVGSDAYRSLVHDQPESVCENLQAPRGCRALQGRPAQGGVSGVIGRLPREANMRAPTLRQTTSAFWGAAGVVVRGQ